ncbi:ImmA/IrrE family metallo-endopeptidase [Nocardia sp. NPDC057663]|uniref:ImmA/IrrE family metallo-endopeptidase n=1 Tax=Nocardia sp. NPDC057663 TaxID=3346201 RepID=UPI00366C0E92
MTAESDGRVAAEKFRADYSLGSQPVGDLVTLIEQTVGADVAVLDAEVDQHGMTMRRSENSHIFIAVARSRNPMRQRSTLAHELGHVVFGDWATAPIVDSASPAESRANVFARHLLVPQEGLREFLGTRPEVDLAALSNVVQWFQVSPQIAAIALEQAGRIDPTTKTSFMEQTAPQLAARYGWSDRYHAMQRESDRRRAPQRLLTRAISGWLQGVVPIEMLATLRGLDVVALQEELADAGVTPVEVVPVWANGSELPHVEVDLTGLDELDDDLHEEGTGG